MPLKFDLPFSVCACQFQREHPFADLLNKSNFPSVGPALPSPLFICVLTAVWCSTRQAASPPDRTPTCHGNCYILWKHHGFACGLAGVTGPAFHLELQLLLSLHGKKWPPSSFLSGALWDTLSTFRDFFARPDLACTWDVQPSTAAATLFTVYSQYYSMVSYSYVF